MNFPNLTEAWSIGYLQSLVTLIVFAFGLPTFVYQISPENIRYIINKYKKWGIAIFNLVLFFSTLCALCFVWFFHPCGSTGEITDWQNMVGTLSITYALVVIPIIWCMVLSKFRRDVLIKFLVKKLVKRFKKDQAIISDELDDLITLGERSDAEYEKEMVLKAIKYLFENILDSEKYSGSALEPVLRKYHNIVSSMDKPGDERNFLGAIETLSKVLERIQFKFANGEIDKESDTILIYWVLTEIGKKASELRLSKVVQRLIPITSKNPKALFEIGLSAFKSGDFSSAIFALSKLKAIALEKPSEHLGLDEFLGLVAHFWTGNQGTRRTASSFLESIQETFAPIDRFIGHAIEFHYSSTHYETMDKLMTMREEIQKPSKKKKSSSKD